MPGKSHNSIARQLRKKRAERRGAAASTSTTTGISPFAPPAFPALPHIDGVRFSAVPAAIRYAGRDDLMLAEIAAGATLAGTFTRSATRAAPVLACEANLAAMKNARSKAPIGILVNSGNANAFTGSHGVRAVKDSTRLAAEAIGTGTDHIFPGSTGVIGEKLPTERIAASLAALADGLAPDRIEDAARAIMTTDTYPKGAGRVVDIEGTPVSIAGMAKGSGMIAPDMATMLVYIFTDAKISGTYLQRLVSGLCDQTFNAITVDSDTSTSDTLLVAATGRAAMKSISTAKSPGAAAFQSALSEVMLDLAHQVVRDGEGATKFVEVAVSGAKSGEDAKKVAMAVANSPLVKTAIAGEDPNWGRIVMAIGKSGATADRDRIRIRLGNITVAEKGWVAKGYTEEAGAAYMKNADLRIGIELGLGKGDATVWTCDLTHSYVSINADYRS